MPKAPPVDRLWPGATVVCVATGPSLTGSDVDVVRGRAKLIAINNAYTLAPWADAVYACDARWWRLHHAHVTAPLKLSLQVPGAPKPADVRLFKKTGREGLERDPHGIRHGHNSGYQAINVAVHLGASRILLLGYDMGMGVGGKRHFHGDHPWPAASNYNVWIRLFRTLVDPLAALGIAVINCTRSSNLDAFPRGDLRALLVSKGAATVTDRTAASQPPRGSSIDAGRAPASDYTELGAA